MKTTTFNGTVYRSQTEALWAVVFHHCCPGAWSYEPQEFKLGPVSYWPDFWLEHIDAYVEIKPAPIDPGHFTKPQELAKMGKRVFVISGKPKIWVDYIHKIGGFRIWELASEDRWRVWDGMAFTLASTLDLPNTAVHDNLPAIWQDIIRINDGDSNAMGPTLAKINAGWSARTAHHEGKDPGGAWAIRSVRDEFES